MQYIINADDFGRTEIVNEAIIFCFDHHFLDRTSIMVNMPYFEQAVLSSEEHKFKNKVGLHINLTSGFPLSDPIKSVRTFCNDSGRFNSNIFRNRRLNIILTSKEKTAVKIEVQAQIDKYLSAGFDLMHADSHGHVHTFPSMLNIIKETLASNNFRSIRINRNAGQGVRGCKKIYKKISNCYFGKMSSSDFFGAIADTYNMGLMSENSVFEVMCHPYYHNGLLFLEENINFYEMPVELQTRFSSIKEKCTIVDDRQEVLDRVN